jgi:uncharacterized phage-associated protein
LDTELASLKSECYAIRDKYPEAASAVQQVYKMLGDIEKLSAWTLAKVTQSSEWISIVNSAQNRANFCKGLDGKPRYHGFVNSPDPGHFH